MHIYSSRSQATAFMRFWPVRKFSHYRARQQRLQRLPWSDTIMHGAQVTGSLNSANTSVTTGCIARQTGSVFNRQAPAMPTNRRKPAAQFMNLGPGPKPLLQVRGKTSTPALARRRDSGRVEQRSTASHQAGRRVPLEGGFPPTPPKTGCRASGCAYRRSTAKPQASRRIQGTTGMLVTSLALTEKS